MNSACSICMCTQQASHLAVAKVLFFFSPGNSYSTKLFFYQCYTTDEVCIVQSSRYATWHEIAPNFLINFT